jgi:16S rRNA G966 N2-methylase RsmD
VRELPDTAMPVFDVVLCDPPYKLSSDELATLLGDLARSGHVSTDAIVVAERARHGQALTVPEQELHVADVRTYGETVLYYLRYGPVVDDGGADRP